MDLGSHKRTSKLVQSTITPAFFTQGRDSSRTSSPYLSRPSLNDYDTKDKRIAAGDGVNQRDESSVEVSKLNLHTERRSKLNRAPPTLSSSPSSRRSVLLAHVAAETKAVLPNVLKLTPNAPPAGELYGPSNLSRLDRRSCPKFPRIKVRVFNADSIDAALSSSLMTAATASMSTSKPVLILNMANAYHSGGGWEHGALAQEEALCYRSSLPFTLKIRFYPIPEAGGIYSPTVVVIRESMAKGHHLLDLTTPNDLPVVSCVSVAAIRDPDIVRDNEGRQRYKHMRDREAMKEKMRVVLRIAATMNHSVLVLGALGCGAFGNPHTEVVQCWKEVLQEEEFGGGWWESIVFAVMEEGGQREGDGNFGAFWRGLDGLEI